MKKASALLALALASTALVACGGDGDDTTAAGGSTTGGETTATSQGAVVLKLTANADNQLSYDQKSLAAKTGTVSIDFDNPATIEHDVAVEDSSGKVLGTSDLVSQGKVNLTIADLTPGTYTFFCTVPGHREAGMEGPLTIG